MYVYRGTLPPVVALLLLAPLLFLFLSFAAVLVAGGALTALVLPIFWRRGVRGRPAGDYIELDRNQYSRVDDEGRKLPKP